MRPYGDSLGVQDDNADQRVATVARAGGRIMLHRRGKQGTMDHPATLRQPAQRLALDSMLVLPRVHAAIDGHLATARGPWSDGPFVSAELHLLASAPKRAA